MREVPVPVSRPVGSFDVEEKENSRPAQMTSIVRAPEKANEARNFVRDRERLLNCFVRSGPRAFGPRALRTLEKRVL